MFEWSPEHNFNSEAHGVRAGDTVYGKITYCPNNHTYTIYHSSLADGWSVTNSIPIQRARASALRLLLPPQAASLTLSPAALPQRPTTAATRSSPWPTS